MSVRVDDVRVPALGTLLEACRAAGAEVPAFCHDDRLSVGGHCRSCMVELDGRMVAACCTPSREGATVVTKSDRLREYRRDLGELMLSESAPAGPVGVTLGAWGADGSRYGRPERHPRRDASHAYLRIDLDHCILCRRCVRACEEIQGQFVYGIEGRGAEAMLAWGTERFAESPCVSCGACVTACPTDALTDLDRLASRAHPPAATSVTRTTCGYCGVGCQLEAHAASGTIARIEGASEAAVNHGHLCVKGRYAHGFVRHRDRLTTPLIRRGGRLERADWDDAIAVVARELMARRGHVAGLSSSRCTNEENYLFQKWFRALLGTNDVDCCARVCHAPSAVGMRAAFGTGAATNSLDDIERADLLLVIGANITEAHPVTGARVKRAAIGGVPLVVVDPRRTELASIADVHLQLRPGTNVPLLNAFACALVEEDLVDREFIAARVEGWAEFEPFIRRHTPELAASVTGVPAEKIREAARLYGCAARPMALHGLGVTEHLQGSEAVMLICNMALLTGALGRAGVGVNPLRGQNNVQGAADMGCAPDYLPGYQLVADPESRARVEAVWGRALPTTAGRTIPAMYDAVCAGDIRAMVVFGEDIVQTDPNTDRVRETLAKLEFLVVQELFLSETAELAHVVLPGASFLEKDGTFTNGERRIQRVRAVVPPIAGARADWEILLGLMAATGLPQPFRHPSEIIDEIARVAPIFAGVSYDRLEGDGLQWPVPSRDHPGTAILHTGSFPRGLGRLSRIEYVPSPELKPGLTLVTGRVLAHYNAGSMTRRTGDRAIAADEQLEIHPDDAATRGIAHGHRVIVTSAHGHTEVRAQLTDRVPPGTVFLSFHFPDARTNALTSDVRDRLSDCPEYKVTAVEVHRAGR